jgi:hypothetical protein
MKKIIIAAALTLVSGVTAYSLTSTANKADSTVKIEKTDFDVQSTSSAPKSDLATAD